MSDRYTLAEVLAVAQIHPFYNEKVQYPPDTEAIQQARLRTIGATDVNLHKQPLLHKKALYKTIKRLTHDVTPQNTYRHGSYVSITGRGSGGVPMIFAMDMPENQRQRAQMGQFLRLCRVVEPGDFVLSIHFSGSLDLMTEIMENAGATILSAGSTMPPAEVTKALGDYHINMLTSDGSRIIQVVCHITSLPQAERARISLSKIIYTSEPLTRAQRDLIKSTLGDAIKIHSVMGNAEAGPWAISNLGITGEQSSDGAATNFLIDTRDIHIEILPRSAASTGNCSSDGAVSLPDGATGLIVQTSLQRLRNPLLRYVTGDIGSLHTVPDHAATLIPASERKHLRVLRLHGRDRRFSFKWDAMYFDFDKVEAVFEAPECGILQWQVILGGADEDSPVATLEVRDLVDRLRGFWGVLPENEHLVRIVFVKGLAEFETSATAGKVIRYQKQSVQSRALNPADAISRIGFLIQKSLTYRDSGLTISAIFSSYHDIVSK
ncbi:hypothetical protein P168DRAFT_341261 [Aspergillus campestris IBT 28561]|uniref:AMP-dependent synthetase/ligase domain-containing protein n=1 Tax=Aspergillus campestris (strain IBT 28561) TaxID=1392248 RepID=A0A2I1D746_ASPC2|nr:uncharacterized protein P168DRAFT_341261 [Aspergillus campestris IBT 28561]PKY05710.1 hypothetical protein P168DRAFT_341261 [Aspergillus campestris IBT 28561]